MLPRTLGAVIRFTQTAPSSLLPVTLTVLLLDTLFALRQLPSCSYSPSWASARLLVLEAQDMEAVRDMVADVHAVGGGAQKADASCGELADPRS